MDRRHGHHAPVEHRRQRPIDVLRGELAEARGGVRFQDEGDRGTVEFIERLPGVAQVGGPRPPAFRTTSNRGRSAARAIEWAGSTSRSEGTALL